MLLVLYTISTLHHSVRGPLLNSILHKCDHSAIYLLIAGQLHAVHARDVARAVGMVAVRW
jgi:channel protein (hemolysin III family)